MRKVPEHVERDFYAGLRSSSVPFGINDSVEVTAGPHAGCTGAIISIEAVSPVLTFLVELGDGSGDVVVPVEALRRNE